MKQHKEPCPGCGGDKGWEVPHDICRVTGAAITRWEKCPYCADKYEWTEEYEYQDREQA